MSNFLNLNLRDLVHGLVMAVGTGLCTSLLTELKGGHIDWNVVLVSVLSAVLTYILKQLGTDQKGNLAGISIGKQ